MAHSNPLNTLIELATDQRDAATANLGKLRQVRRQSQQQLDALLNYREEYHRRMEAALENGLTMASIDNYRRFLASLDNAIEQQRTQLHHNDQNVDGGKRQWQARQQRLRSFNVLAERRRATANRAEARREQKITDEYAGRAHRRGSH